VSKIKKDDVLLSELACTDAEREWEGMPEFVQRKNKPFREIVVRFTNEKDVQNFAEKIGHTITVKTTYIWISKVPFKGRNVKRRYVDES